MANSKISALTSATTPLAGTETLPVVQSGATTQVSVANLTAGRAVSAASLALTTSPLPTTSGGTGLTSFTANGLLYASSTSALNTSANLIWNGTSFKVTSSGRAISTTGTSVLFASNSATHTVFIGDNNFAYFQFVTLASPTYLSLQYNSAELIRFESSGNLVPKIAGQGINFTSNTPTAGMTSQLLNWYEEGTWTPADASGAGLTFTSVTAKYTRIGRQVTATAVLTFPTTASTANVQISGLPFAASNMGQFMYQRTTTVGAGVGLVSASGTTIAIYNQAGTAVTNTPFSLSTVNLTGTYFV